MSGMRECFASRSIGTLPLTTSRTKRRDCRAGRYRPEKLLLSFSALREESSAVWMDSQDVPHAAHTYDPWVLDARSVRRGHPQRGVHASRPEGSDA